MLEATPGLPPIRKAAQRPGSGHTRFGIHMCDYMVPGSGRWRQQSEELSQAGRTSNLSEQV